MLGRFFSTAKNKGKMQEQFLEYLRGKYGEDFVVHEVSEVQWEEGIQYTAKFSPIENPHLQSEAVAADLEKILGDNYMNDSMSQKLDLTLTNMAKPFFEEELLVFSYLEPVGLNYPPEEVANTNIKLEDYLASNFHILEGKIWFFVSRDCDINVEVEAEAISEFTKTLQGFGFPHMKISVVYVKPNWFKQLKPEDKYTWDNAMGDYYKKENVWAIGSVVVNNSKSVADNTNPIIDSFEENWKYFK